MIGWSSAVVVGVRDIDNNTRKEKGIRVSSVEETKLTWQDLMRWLPPIG